MSLILEFNFYGKIVSLRLAWLAQTVQVYPEPWRMILFLTNEETNTSGGTVTHW